MSNSIIRADIQPKDTSSYLAWEPIVRKAEDETGFEIAFNPKELMKALEQWKDWKEPVAHLVIPQDKTSFIKVMPTPSCSGEDTPCRCLVLPVREQTW